MKKLKYKKKNENDDQNKQKKNEICQQKNNDNAIFCDE
jgi:hypothetical protein